MLLALEQVFLLSSCQVAILVPEIHLELGIVSVEFGQLLLPPVMHSNQMDPAGSV